VPTDAEYEAALFELNEAEAGLKLRTVVSR
jgi:hypothetical protein